MVWALLLITKCYGALTFISSDQSSNSNINFCVASFGNPSLYGLYGRLQFIYPTNCSFLDSFESTDFVVVISLQACYLSDLAYSVQQSGASAIIIADPYWNWVDLYEPKDFDSGMMINILVLAIRELDALQYDNTQAWATYIFDVSITSAPAISYYLTSNYSIDQNFFISLQNLTNKINIELNQISLYIQYSEDLILNDTECINTTSTSIYCLNNSDTVAGAQLLSNSIGIVNFLNFLQGSNATLSYFLDIVLQIYSACNLNYSSDCIFSVFQNNQIMLIPSIGILDYYGDFEWYPLVPFYQIGNNYLYWNNYLESLYCSISSNSDTNCILCDQYCTFNLLNNSDCTVCNTSSCGYSNLQCLNIDGCYTFIPGTCQSDSGSSGISTSEVIIICLLVVFIM